MILSTIIKDAAETIRFFRKKGYDIYIDLSEDFSEDCRKALSEFLPKKAVKEKGVTCPVFVEDTKVAEIVILGNREDLSVLSVPIRYMIERLYDETRKTISEANEHDVYRKALQFIRERYTENITVIDVAKHIGYSESYFGYAFKKKYKMSVSQYVRELQLAKAKDLLENTSFSVSGVASYVGFDDSNYFSLLFKKYFGLSPKEYRKTHSALK